MNRVEILDAARDALGARSLTYGEPEDNAAVVAELWSAFLHWPIAAWQVAPMLALLKIARIAADPRYPDNWIDLAGYAAYGGEVATQVPVVVPPEEPQAEGEAPLLAEVTRA